MAYTVKELAKLSGVSVRTLHFYDETDLLKPAYVGQNSYRYYEEAQLFRLQQILFFRELGFELKQIRTVLAAKAFDQIEALKIHRRALAQKKERIQKLMLTTDRTIRRLKGDTKMKDNEIFQGFEPEKQAEYEEYLRNRYGASHPAFTESRRNVAGWSKADWERSGAEWNSICAELSQALKKKLALESTPVQAIVKRHHEWLKQFWTPNKESYIGVGEGYTGFEWKKAFQAHDSEHPKLALYLAKAMKAFAERNL